MSIDAYIQGYTTRFDQLALLGKPYELEDQIKYILEGFQEEYKQLVDQVESRDSTPSVTEVHEKLLNSRLSSKVLRRQTVLPIIANVANYRGSSLHTGNHGNFQGSNKNNNQSRNNRNDQTLQQQQQFSSRNDNNRGYQGKCQLCGVYGHSARRFSQLQNTAAGSSQSRSYAPASTAWQPQANMASASSYNPHNWIMDSGATHHLTTDLSNLALHKPYTCGEEVTIADGSGLSISHTGSTSLKTPSRSFNPYDILYVPNLHKNLISVYHLCNSNNVSVEFFPTHFQVGMLKWVNPPHLDPPHL